MIGESQYENILGVPLRELEGCAEAGEFKKAYLHMSHNPEWYELICFLRWFYLLEYMRLGKVESVFYLDSDVLLYTSMQELARESVAMGNGAVRGACLFCQSNRATAGISYWTREGLEDFCQMLLNCYRQKKYLNVLKNYWKPFVETGAPGGVCDMTPLSLFYSPNTDRLADLTKVGGGVFDCGINVSSNYVENEYVMHRGMKKVVFDGKVPMLVKNDGYNTLEKAHALHFQGEAKGHMPMYYTGLSFKKKMVSNLKGLAYRLRRKVKMLHG